MASLAARTRWCMGGDKDALRQRRLEGRPVCRCAVLPKRRGMPRVVALRNFDWPQALILDAGGVLYEDERDVRRVALNAALHSHGLDTQLDVPAFGTWLDQDRTGSDDAYVTLCGGDTALASAVRTAEAEHATHLLPNVTPREGVMELVRDTLSTSTAVAVVEARSVTAVQSLLTTHVGAQLATRVVVLGAQHAAGAARWVSPQVMLEAAAESGAEPHRCIVIAHDFAGVDAARCAGMRCVCVPSEYVAMSTVDGLADAVCSIVGGAEFTVDDLTTPGTFWVNPPLPRDVDGNWYKEAAAEVVATAAAAVTEEDAEERELRRILSDLE